MTRWVYVETSAVLRILLEGDRPLLQRLAREKKLVTSVLTQVEATRGLLRAITEHRIDHRRQREGQRWLRGFFRSCDLMALDDAICERAGQPFPIEPVRSLDALHLASALAWEDAVGGAVIFSCDDRVRDNARALGLTVLPA
jgi:uncharacterized protein